MEKKNKVYKRNIYWFNTTYACGAVAVDQDGFVYSYDTAPIFRWMSGKKFSMIMKQLKAKNKLWNCKKIDVDIDPF
jgi:hypothetical protein